MILPIGYSFCNYLVLVPFKMLLVSLIPFVFSIFGSLPRWDSLCPALFFIQRTVGLCATSAYLCYFWKGSVQSSCCVPSVLIYYDCFMLELIAFCHNKKLQGLHVGLNLAIAIALHNIPEVQKSIIQLLSLNETNYLKIELLPPMIAPECFCASEIQIAFFFLF